MTSTGTNGQITVFTTLLSDPSAGNCVNIVYGSGVSIGCNNNRNVAGSVKVNLVQIILCYFIAYAINFY